MDATATPRGRGFVDVGSPHQRGIGSRPHRRRERPWDAHHGHGKMICSRPRPTAARLFVSRTDLANLRLAGLRCAPRCNRALPPRTYDDPWPTPRVSARRAAKAFNDAENVSVESRFLSRRLRIVVGSRRKRAVAARGTAEASEPKIREVARPQLFIDWSRLFTRRSFTGDKSSPN